MITAYTANTPNGVKLTIALAELGLEPNKDYALKILKLSEGQQKEPDFLTVNPNGRIPAIIHHKDGRDIRVFESGAVLLYLAENFGALLPTDPAARIEAIAWTYFQTGGIGPNMGQAGYFKRQNNRESFERFHTESHRLVSVMEGALRDQNYLAGEYSIADIMNFGWLNLAPKYLGFDMEAFPNVRNWMARINDRPGVKAGLAAFE